MKHILVMLLACGLPIILIFILSKLGVSINITIFIGIGTMILLHIFMIRSHLGHNNEKNKEHNHH